MVGEHALVGGIMGGLLLASNRQTISLCGTAGQDTPPGEMVLMISIGRPKRETGLRELGQK